MKNIAIIYHDADFDGKLSNEVCRHWLGKLEPKAEIHSYGWDYGRPVPKVTQTDHSDWHDYDQIYIVDLSVDELMARPELRDKIVWIDHHKSAIEKWDRGTNTGPEQKPPDGGYGGSVHSWERSKDPFHADAGVPEDLKDQFPKGPRSDGWMGIDAFGNSIAFVPDGTRFGGPGLFTGYRIDGVAACRLCWQWFVSESGPHGDPRTHPVDVFLPFKDAFVDRRVPEPELIRLAGEYDIWDHRDPDGKALQFGLRCCNESELANLVCGQFHGTPESEGVLRNVVEGGRMVKSYCDRNNDEYSAAYSQTIKWEGLTFCALNIGQRGNSDLLRGGIKPEHDALFAWRWTGNAVLVSLYHAPGKEHHDLSKIAVQYGGGGHRGACGFRITLRQLADILSPEAETGSIVDVDSV